MAATIQLNTFIGFEKQLEAALTYGFRLARLRNLRGQLTEAEMNDLNFPNIENFDLKFGVTIDMRYDPSTQRTTFQVVIPHEFTTDASGAIPTLKYFDPNDRVNQANLILSDIEDRLIPITPN
jgi:hypothetical protein